MSSEVKYIVIHCSATRPSQNIRAAAIDAWHKARGWLMIGYHFVISRDGRLETGRPLNMNHVLEPAEKGAHVQGFNGVSVGVCLVGGVSEQDVNIPENNFTASQWISLRGLITQLMNQFPGAQVVGHRVLNPGKACPSFDVQEWLDTEGIKQPSADKPLLDLTADPNDELDRHDAARAVTKHRRLGRDKHEQ